MLSKRKTLLALLTSMSLGGTAAADTLGVNAQAGAGLRSQIESESRGMLGSRGSLGARGIGQTELDAAIRADSEVSATTGSTQVGGSAGGEAEIDVDGQGSVEAESRRVTRRGADVADAMSAGFGAEIAGSIDAEVVGEVVHAIDAEVTGQVAQAINAEVVGEVAAAVAAEIEQTLASEVDAAIEHEVQSSIDAELQTAVTGLVGR